MLSSENELEPIYPHIVLSAGVDYITVTGNQEAGWRKVFQHASEYQDFCVKAGLKMYRANRNGYKLSCTPGLQYGKRGSEWMACLSGDFALRAWRMYAVWAKNITRVDLQSTVQYRDYDGTEVRMLYQNALDATFGKAAKGKVMILNALKGDTLYVGSRTSAQMGRIYDKYKQSSKLAQFCNSIRFEVEFKKPLSREVVIWLLDDDPDVARITNRVMSWFEARDILPPAVFANTENAIQFPRKEVTPETRLNWLEKYVRPTYLQLKFAGFGAEADNALGITMDIETITDDKG